MRAATLDRLLAILVVAMVATELVSLRFGSPSGWWLFVVHGMIAGVLAVAVAMKLHSSIPRAVDGRRWGRLGLALIVSVIVIGALVGGYAWVVSGRLLALGSWTVLTLHAWLGLAVVPVVAVHVLPHRWRLLRPPTNRRPRAPAVAFGRRSLLVGGALAAAGVGLFGVASSQTGCVVVNGGLRDRAGCGRALFRR